MQRRGLHFAALVFLLVLALPVSAQMRFQAIDELHFTNCESVRYGFYLTNPYSVNLTVNVSVSGTAAQYVSLPFEQFEIPSARAAVVARLHDPVGRTTGDVGPA